MKVWVTPGNGRELGSLYGVISADYKVCGLCAYNSNQSNESKIIRLMLVGLFVWGREAGRILKWVDRLFLAAKYITAAVNG